MRIIKWILLSPFRSGQEFSQWIGLGTSQTWTSAQELVVMLDQRIWNPGGLSVSSDNPKLDNGYGSKTWVQVKAQRFIQATTVGYREGAEIQGRNFFFNLAKETEKGHVPSRNLAQNHALTTKKKESQYGTLAVPLCQSHYVILCQQETTPA